MTTFDNDELGNLTPLWGLWWAFFAYTLFIALMVQLVLLPYVFSAWHAGDGLLISCFDSRTFHRIAVELAKEIQTQGWTVWKLRPDGHAPAGIAGAVYALTVPKPWVLIPISAALHATAGLVLLRMIQIFLPNWRKALWCVLPFLLCPSAMTWYTQHHKDGYFIAGGLLFLYGWILLARPETWRNIWWRPLTAMLFSLLGAVLVWIVRPYGAQMMQGIGVVLALLLTGVFTVSGARGQIAWRKTIMGIFVAWAVLVVMMPLAKDGISAEVPADTHGRISKAVSGEISKAVSGEISKAVSGEMTGEGASTDLWKKSGMLPSFLENKFYALARTREEFNTGYPDAGSNIDTDVSFNSVWEIVAYLPRAAEIGFLAPFPNQWLEQGTLPANTMMRRISAVEMVGVYLAFIFLPYAIWYWRRRIEMWLILSFCSGMMLIYALAISNVGTLYRVRYGFLMTLVALGIAGFFAAWEALSFSRKQQDTTRDAEECAV